MEPTAGTASINGLDVAKQPLETKKHLAYIPETVTLYRNLSGLENLEYFSALAGRRYSRANLVDLLVRAGLRPDEVTRRVGEYSKGMRQKVGIAIAMAKDARALLLDEPTSGLDPKAANEFSALLTTMSRAGVAILMTTHDLFRAKETGTRVGIMKHGRLVASLATADIGHADLQRLYSNTCTTDTARAASPPQNECPAARRHSLKCRGEPNVVELLSPDRQSQKPAIQTLDHAQLRAARSKLGRVAAPFTSQHAWDCHQME